MPLRDAAAVPITTADDPALQGASVIDFESAAIGPFVSLTLQGVTITTGPAAGGALYVAGTTGPDGSPIHVLTNYRSTVGMAFRFAEPVSAFGFRTFTLVQPATMTAYDAAGQVIEAAVSPAFATHYAGLSAGAPVIARVVFEPQWSVTIDDLALVVGNGPEPGGALRASLGLAALAATRRLRRVRLAVRPEAQAVFS